MFLYQLKANTQYIFCVINIQVILSGIFPGLEPTLHYEAEFFVSARHTTITLEQEQPVSASIDVVPLPFSESSRE